LDEAQMKQQILQFRRLLDSRDLSIDDFELNVDGETFRALMAGEPTDLEVLCRTTQTTRTYRCDGSKLWLDLFAQDLDAHLFASSP
jgi:hypothetical protein